MLNSRLMVGIRRFIGFDRESPDARYENANEIDDHAGRTREI